MILPLPGRHNASVTSFIHTYNEHRDFQGGRMAHWIVVAVVVILLLFIILSGSFCFFGRLYRACFERRTRRVQAPAVALPSTIVDSHVLLPLPKHGRTDSGMSVITVVGEAGLGEVKEEEEDPAPSSESIPVAPPRAVCK